VKTRSTVIALFILSLWLASPRPVSATLLIIGGVIGASLVILGLAACRNLRDTGGAPILDGKCPTGLAIKRLLLSLAVGATCGAVILGILIYGIVPIEPALAARLKARAAAAIWIPWALAAEASVLEEVGFRLFLLSGIVWLLRRVWRLPVSPLIAWSAITVSALGFALAHLPAWLAVTEPTLLLVTTVLALNGLAGLVLGKLYWEWGIEAAVVAHFAADLIVQSLGPHMLA